MKIALSQIDPPHLFLHADFGGNDVGHCAFDRDTIGPHETFVVHDLGQHMVALETEQGRFLSRDSHTGLLQTNRARKSDTRARGDLRTVADDVVSLPHDAWEAFNWDWLHATYLVTVVEADPPVATPLQLLHTDGTDIRQQDGSRWICAGMTNFLLFQRLLEGQDIEPLLYAGAELYRITGTMAIVPGQVGLRVLRPETYGEYWPTLERLADLLAAREKRFEFTALCDQRIIGTDLAWQQRYMDQVYEVLRPKSNVLVELGNEVEHATNQIDYRQFRQPEGIFWCRGSSLSGDKCPLPPGNYSAFHLPRSGAPLYTDVPPIYMQTGYAGYAGVHGPVIINEMIGADEIEKPGSRTTDPEVFRRVARMSSAWNGATFHATDAVYSRPLGPTQERCRAAFFEGMFEGGA